MENAAFPLFQVRVFVPPEQLLIFDVKEGWAPLCHFLELPVPDIPFPNINDANEIRLCCIIFRDKCKLGHK